MVYAAVLGMLCHTDAPHNSRRLLDGGERFTASSNSCTTSFTLLLQVMAILIAVGNHDYGAPIFCEP